VTDTVDVLSEASAEEEEKGEHQARIPWLPPVTDYG
jgi:hypothetical protein